MPERAVGPERRTQSAEPAGAPDLADFLEANKERLCHLWKEQARSRYSPDLDDSQLLDHLPSFVDEVAESLRARGWPRMLSELIDNALVEARMDSESVPRLQRTTVERLIDEALQRVAPLAEEIGVELALEVEPFEVEVDPKLMTSALANLVSNAVKFTKRGTTVVVRAWRDDEDGDACFEVEDRCGGLGADPERLFQPFVQGEGESSGFGLGLMIVQRAVAAHGGSVRVTDHPGRGCTFAVDLPLSGAEAQPD